MEAMEDDSLNMKDDHNHNYCASGSSKVRSYLSSQLSDATTVPQPVCPPAPGGEPEAGRGKVGSGGSKFMDSDSGSESSEVSESDCSAPPAAAEGKFTLDSNVSSKFLLNAMAVEDYRKNHWPNLEKAIDRLLIQNPTDHISVSYAQIYSYVYKCVCQQHSELLYNDLTLKITSHLQQVSTQLQVSKSTYKGMIICSTYRSYKNWLTLILLFSRPARLRTSLRTSMLRWRNTQHLFNV